MHDRIPIPQSLERAFTHAKKHPLHPKLAQKKAITWAHVASRGKKSLFYYRIVHSSGIAVGLVLMFIIIFLSQQVADYTSQPTNLAFTNKQKIIVLGGLPPQERIEELITGKRYHPPMFIDIVRTILNIPNNYIAIQPEDISMIRSEDRLPLAPEKIREDLFLSANHEIQNLDVNNYYYPIVFVKSDGSAYILAYRKGELNYGASYFKYTNQTFIEY